MGTTQIRAVELVRRIRDEQAAALADRSDTEVLAFFRRAGEAAKTEAQVRLAAQGSSVRNS